MKSITEAVKIFAESVEDLDKNPISDSATVIAITNQIKNTLIPVVEQMEKDIVVNAYNSGRDGYIEYINSMGMIECDAEKYYTSLLTSKQSR